MKLKLLLALSFALSSQAMAQFIPYGRDSSFIVKPVNLANVFNREIKLVFTVNSNRNTVVAMDDRGLDTCCQDEYDEYGNCCPVKITLEPVFRVNGKSNSYCYPTYDTCWGEMINSAGKSFRLTKAGACKFSINYNALEPGTYKFLINGEIVATNYRVRRR